MRTVALSQLKAQLSSFIRLVKSGEVVEVHERGIPVAHIKPLTSQETLIIPPRADPSALAKLVSRITPPKNFDVVEILSEDRDRR